MGSSNNSVCISFLSSLSDPSIADIRATCWTMMIDHLACPSSYELPFRANWTVLAPTAPGSVAQHNSSVLVSSFCEGGLSACGQTQQPAVFGV